MAHFVWQIALAVPLYQSFDYLPPASGEAAIIGARVKVPFGKKKLVGIVTATTQSQLPKNKLKSVIEQLDQKPLLDEHSRQLISWASYYYKYPLGQALSKALAPKLRHGSAAQLATQTFFSLTTTGKAINPASFNRAPKQQQLLQALQQAYPQAIAAGSHNRQPAKALITKGLIKTIDQIKPSSAPEQKQSVPPALTDEQQKAFSYLSKTFGQFSCTLLEGITGSGKTEIYLHLIAEILAKNQQVLLLAPEIGLTPQLFSRCQQRFGNKVYSYHSQLSGKNQLQSWLMAHKGQPLVLVGTRSAVFIPLPKLGLIIVDEEHDSSFKDQQGFCYSAKDVAIKRAKLLNIPVLLGSATPTLESLYAVQEKRYHHLTLSRRATAVKLPKYTLIDMRQHRPDDGFTQPTIKLITHYLSTGNQVLVFLNRRGYAPVVTCESCGWSAHCINCDARLVLHFHKNRLACHYCDYHSPLPQQCPDCQSPDIKPYGRGTERVEHRLRSLFPDYTLLRVDSDTIQSNQFEALAREINKGYPMLLVGTQMLAKGHHFPNINLVVMLQADLGLYHADFRAAEKLYQLIVQTSGRSGRHSQGEVIIQTYNTDNPMLQLLLTKGYHTYAQQALKERQQANFPPFSYMAMINCSSLDSQLPMQFLQQIQQFGQTLICRHHLSDICFKGPIAAYMAKKAGYHHAGLLCQAHNRKTLHQLLDQLMLWVHQSPDRHKVRFGIDIDPQQLF